MSVGSVWPAEGRVFEDPVSGVRVRQLTDYRAHSHHFYFTNNGWWDGERRLMVSSDRGNRTNLYSADLETGELTQLTDLEPLAAPLEVEFVRASLNPVREEATFWYGRKLMAVHLRSLEARVLWERPEGFTVSMLNSTADGKYVCAGIYEDLSDRMRLDFLRGYVGFAEHWAARPLSRVMKVAADGSGAETVWEEKSWIGHVNTSPTVANVLTFCHEGPWDKVDHRIWGLDLETGDAWKIRPCEEGEIVGHEYWHADGEMIGYHGRKADGEEYFGHIRYDNTGQVEVKFPHTTGHIHSNDMSLVVGDGGGVIRLWQWNGENYDGPKLLCGHRSSWHIQQLHPHPRFNSGCSQVVFTSDLSGYGNVYLADVPEFDSLPDVEGD